MPLPTPGAVSQAPVLNDYLLVEHDVNGLHGVPAAVQAEIDDAVSDGVGAHVASQHATSQANFPSILTYGADPLGVSDSADDIQEAIDAVAASNGGLGGILLFPPGIYRCLSEITYSPKVEYWGAGYDSTLLFWPVDLGLGKWGLKSVIPPGAPTAFRYMTLQGPAPNLVMGTRTVNMNGIRLSPHSILDTCKITNFGVGITDMGDHQIHRDCVVQYNWVGCEAEKFGANDSDWTTGSPTMGDQLFSGGEYTFNSRAGFSVGLGKTWNGVKWDRVHVGFEPYCWWRDNQAHADPFIIGCSIDRVTCEDVGNAVVADFAPDLAQPSLTASRIVISTSGQFAAGHRIAAESYVNMFKLGAAYGNQFEFQYPSSLMAGMTRYFSAAYADPSNEIRGLYIPATADTIWTGSSIPGPTIVSGAIKGTIQYAIGTITQGDLVAFVPGGVQRLTAANIDSYLGVAMEDAVNTNYLPVATGKGAVALVRSELVTMGALLRPLSGTEHRATSSGVLPVIGQAATAGGLNGLAGALVQAYLR